MIARPPIETVDRIGPYNVLRELGRGGMGVVLLGVDPAIGRQVAIKVIRLEGFADPKEKDSLRNRLFREAQSAGILSHPNIVTIYYVGEEGQTAFIAMEYVGGPNLEKILSSPEPLIREGVCRILRQIAAGLDYAHAKGIIHRDIKPANIMLDDKGDIKICDFGIAKGIVGQASLTQSGVSLGTPYYMSPEQIRGEHVQAAADQYSFAVVAYQLLTGQRPFEADSIQSLFFRIMSDPPVPAHQKNPALSSAVSDVFQRALSKAPAGRYANCSEFVETLVAAWQKDPVASPPPEPIIAETILKRPDELPETKTLPPRHAGKFPWVPVALVVALLAAGVVGYLAWPTHPTPIPTPSVVVDKGGPPPKPQPAVIETFAADPPTIKAGKSATLSWSVKHATEVRIDHDLGPVAATGTRVVRPETSTTYTLQAKASDGSTVPATTSVIVETVVVPPTAIAVVNWFTVEPQSVVAGKRALLKWSVQNAQQVRIEPGVGLSSAVGAQYVAPDATTTYRLFVKGINPPPTTVLTVEEPPRVPVIDDFSASPSTVESGQAVTLTWSVRNAGEVSIPGVGKVGPQGSKTIYPTISKSYTLQANGPDRPVTRQLPVIVNIRAGESPHITTFRADPPSVRAGEATVLRWHVDNASKVWMEPGGEVEADGMLRVFPDATKKYRIFASGRGTFHLDVEVQVTK